MSYMWGEELEWVSVVQHFHANSISKDTDSEGYRENPNFLAKIYISSTFSINFNSHQRAGEIRAGKSKLSKKDNITDIQTLTKDENTAAELSRTSFRVPVWHTWE